MNKLFLWLVLVMVVGRSVLAEEVQVPAPSAPFVSKTPAVARWIVVQESAAATSPRPGNPETAAKNAPLVLKQIRVSKMDDRRQELSFWSNNTTTENWFVGFYGLYSYPGTDVITILNSARPSLTGLNNPDFHKSDFPDLNWLTLSNYAGTATYRGIRCYYFQTKATSGTEAWIDMKTKLPVALATKDVVQVYTFQGADFERPVLPEHFAKELKAYQGRENQSKYLMKQ